MPSCDDNNKNNNNNNNSNNNNNNNDNVQALQLIVLARSDAAQKESEGRRVSRFKQCH